MIITAGMIGIGKSLLTKRLSEELNTKPFYEPVDDNPILDKYYEDQDKYGFALQIYFLNKRFDLIKKAYFDDDNVLDRSIYEDALFTKINTINGSISEEEYQIYLDLLDNMMEEIDGMPKKAPDLLIFLDGSFEHVLNNIKKRGREYEQISEDNGLEEYYRQLHEEYSNWFEEYDKSPKLRIQADEYDMHDEEDWQKMYKIIESKLEEVRSGTLV